MALDHIRIIPLVMLIILLPLPTYADETISWQECVERAQNHNPDLHIARELVIRSAADLKITRSEALPDVRGEMAYERSDSSSGGERDTYSAGISARQMIFDGFRTSNEVSAARASEDSARYRYKIISSDVRLKLRTAFVELLRAQELLKITGEIVLRREQNAELVRLRYEAGREHRGSLLTAEANLAQSEFDSEQARRKVALSRRSLSLVIGRDISDGVVAEGALQLISMPDVSVDISTLADMHPVVNELAALRDTAMFQARAAKGDYYPSLYLNARIGVSDETWPPEEDEWSAGLQLSYPFYEGGARSARVLRANALARQTEAEMKSGRNEIIEKLDTARADLNEAMSFVKVQRKFLEASRERANIARAQYGSGLISFDTWTIIEDEIARKEVSYLEALYNAHLAAAEWVHSKGGALEDE